MLPLNSSGRTGIKEHEKNNLIGLLQRIEDNLSVRPEELRDQND
jgi:hypothetical protein